jgi:hypothetical protein
MKLRIIAGPGSSDGAPPSGELATIVRTAALTVEASSDVQVLPLAGHARLCVLGHPVGWRSRAGALQTFSPGHGELAALASGPLEAAAEAIEGRFALVRIGGDGRCDVVTDAFAQIDLYYQRVAGGIVVATDMSLLPVSRGGSTYDQAALAHALCVFGWRPPKRHTFYTDVRRLGVGESLAIAAGTADVIRRPFVPTPTGSYGPAELEEYGNRFLEALEARGSRHGNVIYLSSGWDSTAILACLVKIFGRGRVRAVIGRMKYAERSGVINQVEVDRAHKMAEYYGVRLDIAEFDYCSSGPDHFEALQPVLRAHNIGGLGALNHWRLANFVARTTPGDEAVFAGEISDGAHNLGFAQFFGIFHPSLEFREYSDKMLSYLFGPGFLSRFEQGQAQEDPIYELFKSRAGGVFDELSAAGPAARRLQMLSSFFLRGNRLPLWSLDNTRILTATGRRGYQEQIGGAYLAEAAQAMTPETLYAWYLHLYNSFHWQGSTVATIALTAEIQGLRMEMPFWDQRIQEFLSGMPESWGRGLDLNPTKYPLKWMLKHRIDYPMHFQTGPHSYLYDVNPRFSLAAEVLHASAFSPHLAEALRKRPYRELLSDEWFDVDYLDRVADRYLTGQEAEGAELNDLTLLCWFSIVGAYGV